jgi:hypothetical protein
MHGRFDGILIGYLPHQGHYELKTYAAGIIHGTFTDRLKSITRSCPSHYHHLINKPCRFFVDDDLRCDRIELSDTD